MRTHTPITRAILYDAPVQGAMAALTQSRPFGMLPFANRPLLHHVISNLAELGVREIDVFTASHYEDVASYLSAGERWGVAVRSHRQQRVPGNELPPEVAAHRLHGGLVMRLDCWPGKIAMQAFLEGSGTRNRQLLGERGPLQCFYGDLSALAERDREWPMVYCYSAFQLDTPAQYLRANLDCLVRLESGTSLEQPYDDCFYMGTGCQISESARFEGPALLGKGSRVGRAVNFGPDVIAGEHVFLDAHCKVRNSVILDGTYVGRGVSLRNKIVDGSRIIDCKTGEVSSAETPAELATAIRRISRRKLARGIFRWLTEKPGFAA